MKYWYLFILLLWAICSTEVRIIEIGKQLGDFICSAVVGFPLYVHVTWSFLLGGSIMTSWHLTDYGCPCSVKSSIFLLLGFPVSTCGIHASNHITQPRDLHIIRLPDSVAEVARVFPFYLGFILLLVILEVVLSLFGSKPCPDISWLPFLQLPLLAFT